MQLPVLILFVLVMFGPYASSLGAPRVLEFTPELMSLLFLVYILVAGPRRRFHLVGPKYWLLFGALTAIIIAGIVNGGASPGPILSALRFYLRAMPLFFLPAVCNFGEEQQIKQLKLLMLLSLVQLPVAGYQRYVVWSEGRFTGDPVMGTVLDSGGLSIFLICAALVASGLMLRGRMSKRWYVALLLALLLPTTINETKVTVFFVPIGMLVAFAVGATPGKRLKVAASTLVILLTFGAIFFPIYTYFQSGDPYANQDDLIGVLTNQKDRNQYLIGGAKGVGARSKDVHRGDSLLVPLQYISSDPVTLGLGLGLGAVSPSQLGEQFEGRYYQLFKVFLQTSFSNFVLEIGVLGVAALLLLYWFLFSDALTVARYDDSLVGGIAVGWAGVVVLMCISLTYTEIQMSSPLSYVFWYFSGMIAARRVQLGYQAESTSTARISGSRPAVDDCAPVAPASRRDLRRT